MMIKWAARITKTMRQHGLPPCCRTDFGGANITGADFTNALVDKSQQIVRSSTSMCLACLNVCASFTVLAITSNASLWHRALLGKLAVPVCKCSEPLICLPGQHTSAQDCISPCVVSELECIAVLVGHVPLC